MADARYAITLKSFSFPSYLKPKNANFRFALDLRFASVKKGFTTVNSIIPSAGSYWECDPGKVDDHRYVRDTGNDRFLMTDVLIWDATAFLISAEYIHEMHLSILDVNRKDGWEKISSFIGNLVGGVANFGEKVIPDVFSDAAGTVVDDLKSLATKKLAGGDTDELVRMGSGRPISMPINMGDRQDITFTAEYKDDGNAGENFVAVFEIEKLSA